MYAGVIAEVEGVEMEIALAIACFLIGYLLARVWKLGERVERLEADNVALQSQTEFLTKMMDKELERITANMTVIGAQLELLWKKRKQEEKQ